MFFIGYLNLTNKLINCNIKRFIKIMEEKMRVRVLFILVILITIFVSGCYIETTARGHSVKFPLLSNPHTGQFDSATGQRVWSNELIYIAFVNNSSNSFTITVTSTRDGFCFFSDVIYPGNYSRKLFSSGEYKVSIRRGVGYTHTNRIIIWDEGDFEINGQLVDVKIDLYTLWLQCGGEEKSGGYKF